MRNIKWKIILGVSFLILFSATQTAQAAFPGLPLVPCDTSANPTPCNQCDLFKLARNILDFLSFGLMPIVAALLFTFAGLLILVGGAVPSQYKRGIDIFKNTFIGLLIMYSAWLITNTVIKSLQEGNTSSTCVNSVCSNNSSRSCQSDSDCQDKWYQFTCTATVGGGTTTPPTDDDTTPPSGTTFACNDQDQCVATDGGQYSDNQCDGDCEPPPASSDCEQSFSISAVLGCSNIASCVNVNNLAKMNAQSCATNSGNCILSSSTAAQAKKFIDKFNSIASGCSLYWSSTVQVSQQVSSSTCHKPNKPDTGTCADFNVLPGNDSCFEKFYEAARDSGAIKYLLNEYIPACVKSTTTGGNIHVVFGGGSALPPPAADCPISPPLAWSGSDPFTQSDIWAGSKSELKQAYEAFRTAYPLLRLRGSGALYRPPAYQDHLRSVWDTWQFLNGKSFTITDPTCSDNGSTKNPPTTDPNVLRNCAALKGVVQKEVTKHGLGGDTRPYCASDHTKGIGIDLEPPSDIPNGPNYLNWISIGENLSGGLKLCHHVPGDEPHFGLYNYLPANDRQCGQR